MLQSWHIYICIFLCFNNSKPNDMYSNLFQMDVLSLQLYLNLICLCGNRIQNTHSSHRIEYDLQVIFSPIVVWNNFFSYKAHVFYIIIQLLWILSGKFVYICVCLCVCHFAVCLCLAGANRWNQLTKIEFIRPMPLILCVDIKWHTKPQFLLSPQFDIDFDLCTQLSAYLMYMKFGMNYRCSVSKWQTKS